MLVTVLEKVIEHGDDVHSEQHPDPPCHEHTTSDSHDDDYDDDDCDDDYYYYYYL